MRGREREINLPVINGIINKKIIDVIGLFTAKGCFLERSLFALLTLEKQFREALENTPGTMEQVKVFHQAIVDVTASWVRQKLKKSDKSEKSPYTVVTHEYSKSSDGGNTKKVTSIRHKNANDLPLNKEGTD